MKKRKKTNKTLGKLDKKALVSRLTKGDGKTKGKFAASGIQMGRDLVLGGLIGGGLGHLVGRPGALMGIGINGLAYYLGYPGMAGLGTGMLAAGLFKARKDPAAPNARLADGSVDDGGLPKRKEQFKARFKEATEAIKYNLYLDKLPFLKKKDAASTTGEGNLGMLGNPTLDEIESQLLSSAIEFQRQNSAGGFTPEIEEPQEYALPLADSSQGLMGGEWEEEYELADHM